MGNKKKTVILDCYTDEPAGLGVPPYIGTYPRYIAGLFDEIPLYLTIDDLRLYRKHGSIPPDTANAMKTDITTYNLTKNYADVGDILNNAQELIVIVGVHTPGKYLSAMPGTLHELIRLLEGVRCKKVLTGPAIHGTQLHGGRFTEKKGLDAFDEVRDYDHRFDEIGSASIKGARIIRQIPHLRIAEIETSRGCSRKSGCSFCLEPLKQKLTIRPRQDILEEIRSLHAQGIRDFRLGKQSCIYAYPDLIPLLREIHDIGDIHTLHIDNANPQNVVDDQGHEKTKAIVRYCTEGNVAAFGVESFDEDVVKKNNLNADPKTTIEAIRIINRFGSTRGKKGMPHFLPGINILFGLIGETRETFEKNLDHLHRILESGLLIRRINIRQVVPFPGTPLEAAAGNKYLRKNRRFYYGWRKKIRENIDHEMLKNIVPKNTILKGVIPEIYDGNTTFCRQIGTYPLIIGVKERIPLREPVDIRVTGYMLRSIVGEVQKNTK